MNVKENDMTIVSVQLVEEIAGQTHLCNTYSRAVDLDVVPTSVHLQFCETSVAPGPDTIP